MYIYTHFRHTSCDRVYMLCDRGSEIGGICTFSCICDRRYMHVYIILYVIGSKYTFSWRCVLK